MTAADDAQVTAPPPPQRSPLMAALWVVISAAALTVPLFVARTDMDAFRLPKQLLYEAFAAIVAALLVIHLLYRGRELVALLRAHLPAVAVAGAALVWTAITTLTSTNRTLSVVTLLWVSCVVVMFLGTLAAARHGSGFLIIVVVFIPAAINSLMAVLQRTALYNPLYFSQWVGLRARTTGLIGNPNDVATYLLFPALAAVAATLATRHRKRAIAFGALALVLTAGMLATQTLTSIAAYFCGVLVLVIMRTRKVVAPILVVATCAVLLFVAVKPLRDRIVEVGQFARSRQYVQLLSLRVPAFAVAWEMFKDHPVVGVGPGTFGWWYLPYKVELNERYPTFYASEDSFAEAHNDHLQTMAVAGFPAYVIFVSAVVLLARISLRRTGDDPAGETADGERQAFSRLVALPFAVAFAVVTFAQFPLELASATSVMVHLCAVCVAWSRP